MNVGSVSQHNLIATDASRIKTRPTRATDVGRDFVVQQKKTSETFAPKALARDAEPATNLTYPRTLGSTLNTGTNSSSSRQEDLDQETPSVRSSSQETQLNKDQQDSLLARHSPVQQKAIDFYNITASLGNAGGEGELIGVDTYA